MTEMDGVTNTKNSFGVEESDSDDSGEDDVYTSSGEDDSEGDDDDALTGSVGFNEEGGPQARIETDFEYV
jgi:hypothetical protein